MFTFSQLKNIREAAAGQRAGRKRASALILTMFIMAGMLIVALSGVYVIILGIKASGVQLQSAKAYYVAEAGAERLLWELRKNNCQFGHPSCANGGSASNNQPVFTGSIGTGLNYYVYYVGFPPLIFQSVGEFQNTRRSIELRI
jgi:hypothetical protein